MFLYFSTSDLRYFLESNLYFIQICIFWFVANRIKIWSSGDITSKVPRLSTRLSHFDDDEYDDDDDGDDDGDDDDDDDDDDNVTLKMVKWAFEAKNIIAKTKAL